MKRVLWIWFFIGFGMQSSDVSAQFTNSLKFFSDEAGTSCSLNYTSAGVVSTHVLMTGGRWSAAIQFSAVTPACWTGAVWVGDDFPGPFIREGSTQDIDGLALAIGCQSMPFHAGVIYHYVSDVSASCCPYAPGPAYPVLLNGILVKRIIATIGCEPGVPLIVDSVASEMQGVGLTVNANATCPCDLPVATAATTWGRVKALYR